MAQIHAPAVPRADRIERTDKILRDAHRRTGSTRRDLLNQAIELNLPVARSISRQFRQRGVSRDDLEQVAMLGLTKAVNGFDPGHGKDFLAYAVPTIAGEIKRYFRDQAWIVRPPRRIQDLQGAISACTAELAQRLGRPPRPKEIAEYLERDLDEVIEALACGGCFNADSLDDKGPDGDGRSLADHLASHDRGFARSEARLILQEVCRDLTERERRILYLRFIEEKTQQQIGDELGVTQMQVSRLLSQILRRLRDRIEGSPATKQVAQLVS